MSKLRRTGLIALLALTVTGCAVRRGELKPLRPTATPAAMLQEQPQLVTFAELEADSLRYRDRLVRVSGVFYHLPPPGCFPSSGRTAAWALVDGGLRLDSVGLDEQVRLSAEELSFTVDGIFRLYSGPIGCGKEPPAGTSWYLEALQIIQPNPLIRSTRPPAFTVIVSVPTIAGPVLIVGDGQTPPAQTPGAAATTPPAATATPPVGATGVGTTATPTPVPPGSPAPGASPTAPPASPSAAPTAGPTPTLPPGGYPPPSTAPPNPTVGYP